MRLAAVLALGVVLALAACKSHKAVPVDTSESSEIPREVALERLSALLPTAELIYCTLPKHSLKQSDVKALIVRPDCIEIDHGKEKHLTLNYADIVAVNLEMVGKHFTARVFTLAQNEKDKEHFGFQWRMEDSAKRAVELLASLVKKK